MPDFDIDAALAEPDPTARRRVGAYEVVDVGIDNGQYFRGVGRVNYDDVFVGNGDTPNEALNFALEQADYEWDTVDVVSPYSAAMDREWCVSRRLRVNWEAELDLEANGVADVEDPEEKEVLLDELWQEACDGGYGEDTSYFVGLRVSEVREDEE